MSYRLWTNTITCKSKLPIIVTDLTSELSDYKNLLFHIMWKQNCEIEYEVEIISEIDFQYIE